MTGTTRYLPEIPDDLPDGPRPMIAVVQTGRGLHGPPVPNVPLRFAVEDIDIDVGDGVTLRAGEGILACYGAAGRDPLMHDSDAGRFDVTRAGRCRAACALPDWLMPVADEGDHGPRSVLLQRPGFSERSGGFTSKSQLPAYKEQRGRDVAGRRKSVSVPQVISG